MVEYGADRGVHGAEEEVDVRRAFHLSFKTHIDSSCPVIQNSFKEWRKLHKIYFELRQFEPVDSLDERHVLGHVLARNVLRQLPHEIREDGLVVGDVGAHLRWVKSQ